MDPSCYTEEVQKAHAAALLDVGNKLANPPSSIDQLLTLLTRAEYLLSHVQQRCTCHEVISSVQDAIHPALHALISDTIFKHSSLDVQVAVASCINEIVRVTIWESLYTDAQMKEIFRLFIVAFKQLSCESGKNYERALRILGTMAGIKSCLVMLDLNVEMNAVVVEMFQIFLGRIRPHHSSDIFDHMKKIMILIVQEDEFSVELPRTLLLSVRMDNKDTSPRSWELGKSVIENCATILQQHIREAVKAENLNVADYAEIIASLCQDSPIANDTLANEEVAGVHVANGEIEEVANVQMENEEVKTDASGDVVSKLDERSQAGPETQIQAERRRREIKLNTLMRPEEGYQHAWLGGGSASSQEENDFVKEVSVGKRAKSKNRDSTMDQANIQEVSDKQKKTTKGVIEREQKLNHSAFDSEGKDNNAITSQKHELGDVLDKVVESPVSKPEKAKLSKVKEKGCKMRKKTTKRVVIGSVTIGTKKEQVNHSASASELKAENESTASKHDSADVLEKVVESSISIPKKAKQHRVDKKGSNKGKKSVKGGVVRCTTVGAENAMVRKGKGNEIISKKHESGDVLDKVVDSPMLKPAEAKQSKVDEGSNELNKTTRSDVQSRKVSREKEKVSPNVADSLEKDENEILSRKHESADVEKVVEWLPKQSKVEQEGSNKQKRRTKSCVLLSSTVGEKEKVGHSVADSKGEGKNEITSQNHESGDVMDKVVESPTSMLPKAKQCEIMENGSNKLEKTAKSVVVQPNAIGAEKEKMLQSPTSKRTKDKRSKAKEKGSNKQKKAAKNVVVRSNTLDVEKENVHSDADPEREDENEVSSRKLEKCESGIVIYKDVESPMSKRAEYPGDLDSEKNKEPMDFHLEYGRELVNLRIMVWWPLDKTYYTGSVESYDPVTKKHKIRYDDDDEEEMLDMSVERWELFNEAESSHKREANPSPPKEPANRTQKKATKRKTDPSMKEPAGPPFKRSKSEDVKSGHSELESIPVNDESNDDETCEANFSWKARAMSRAGKQSSNTSRRKGKPSRGTPNDAKTG